MAQSKKNTISWICIDKRQNHNRNLLQNKEIPMLSKLLKDESGPLKIEEKELEVLNIL